MKDGKLKPIIDCVTYDNSLSSHVDDQLVINITDVDDLAAVWYVTTFKNKQKNLSFQVVSSFSENITDELPLLLWREGGRHGSETINFTQWFHDNYDNFLTEENNLNGYLVVAIFDFEYNKWYLPGGKWSFDAKLTLNGSVKWKKHMFMSSQKGNTGLQYLKIFTLNKDNNHFFLSESVDQDAKEFIEDKIISNYHYHGIVNNILIKKEKNNG